MAVTIRKVLTISIFTLLLAWVLSSCEQHELCYNHDHMSKLNVHLDWREAPDANPGSMFLFLYPEDSTRALKRDFAGNTLLRTDILVDLGYDVLTVNSDFNNDILLGYESMEDVRVTTPAATTIKELGISTLALPKTRGSEDEEMRMETDPMFSAHSTQKAYLSFEQYYGGKDVQMTLFPRPLFCNYHVIVRNVKNIDQVKGGIAASLSGLSGSVNAYTEKLGDEAVTIPFAMLTEEKADSKRMIGSLKCFGRATSKDVPNKLAFYTVLKDGTKWSYVYDVTKQVMEAPDYRNVTIVIDELPLPENIGENSGIKPGVSDWEVVDIPLIM